MNVSNNSILSYIKLENKILNENEIYESKWITISINFKNTNVLFFGQKYAFECIYGQ